MTCSASAKVGSTEKPWNERSIVMPRNAMVPAPFLPTVVNSRSVKPAARNSSATANAWRTMLTLNAPARPRSPVIATTTAVPSVGRSSRRGSPATPPLWRAACAISRRIAVAYGRRASMFSCAWRILAEATSSMARVILRVLRTDSIRRLMSRVVAMSA